MYTRYGKAEVGSPLMEHSQEELADCEGLVVRVRGDGQVYCVVLTTGMSALSQHSALHLCVGLQLQHGVSLDQALCAAAMYDRPIACEVHADIMLQSPHHEVIKVRTFVMRV